MRGSALGAFTALSDDIASIDWNPAGLVSVRDWDVTASLYSAFRRDVSSKGISLYAAGSAKRFLDYHVVAGSYAPGLNLEFKVSAPFSLDSTGPRIDQEEHIAYREQYALGYGYQMTPTVGLGLSARYREQSVTSRKIVFDQEAVGARIRTDEYTANAWNIDIGLLWKPSAEWSLGAVAKNLFRLTESELPEGVLSYGLRNVKTLRIGAAYHPNRLTTVALDLDTRAMGGIGSEWTLSDQWQVRQGIWFGGRSEKYLAGLSAGVGFSYGPAKINVSYVHFLDQ